MAGQWVSRLFHGGMQSSPCTAYGNTRISSADNTEATVIKFSRSICAGIFMFQNGAFRLHPPGQAKFFFCSPRENGDVTLLSLVVEVSDRFWWMGNWGQPAGRTVQVRGFWSVISLTNEIQFEPRR